MDSCYRDILIMSFTLRQYQQDIVTAAAIKVRDSQHVLIQAAGGTGKTKTFLFIAMSAMSKGHAVIIITDRTAVYKQVSEESKGITIGEGVKDVGVHGGMMYVAMAQTLKRRKHIIDKFNALYKKVLVIVDEVHVSTAMKVLDSLTNRFTLGFTATPDYRIAKHLHRYFNDIVCAPDVQWFIDNGYLCDYQHIVRKSGEGTSTMEKNSSGDFKESEQRRFFGTEEHYRELFADMDKYPFNKCMLFCSSIEHAEDVYNRFILDGRAASIVHSKRSDSAYEIAKFEDLNESNVLISVGSMTTGYDYPPVDLIVLYRATTSLALYLQMIFRGDRPKEGMFFRVLDYGLNGVRHMPYNYPHNWSNMWQPPKRKKKDSDQIEEMGVKSCPNCDSLVSSMAKICKFCNFQFPAKEENLSSVGEEVDITDKKALLTGKSIGKMSAKDMALYANLFDRKKFATKIARIRTVHGETDFLSDFAKAMGYKDNWVKKQMEFASPNDGFVDFVVY